MTIKHIQIPIDKKISSSYANEEQAEKASLSFVQLYVQQANTLDNLLADGWQIISDHIAAPVGGLILIHFILWKPNESEERS